MDQRFESIIFVTKSIDNDFDLRLVRVCWCCTRAVREQFFGQVAGELVFVVEE